MSYKNKELCTIFNGEYGIFLVGNISFDENISKLFLECHRIDNDTNPIVCIKEVYDFLEKTHFINFLVSKIFKRGIWSYEAINKTILNKDDTEENISKIMITVETSNIPFNIIENIMIDSVVRKISNIDKSIPKVPMIVNAKKIKSYYRPIVAYDLDIGFSKNSIGNFYNMNFHAIYLNIIKTYIYDAISEFNILPELVELYGEKVIRMQHIVVDSENFMNIKLVCTPSMYVSKEGDILKYIYADEETHLFKKSKMKDSMVAIADKVIFLNNVSSSELSQVMMSSYYEDTTITEFCEDYNIIKCEPAIFTPNRIVLRNDIFKEKQSSIKIFSNLLENFSTKLEYIESYWKPTTPIILSDNGKSSMEIYGFINIDKEKAPVEIEYSTLCKSISAELYLNFGLTHIDYEHNNFRIHKCYDGNFISRVVLYSFGKDRKETTIDKSKKIRKPFWRTKK